MDNKIKLAQMGLGFKEMKFNVDGDASFIHSTIINAYPDLEFCGGYCLMRLCSGSSDLVKIEPPRIGLHVCYLCDILQFAKLSIAKRYRRKGYNCGKDAILSRPLNSAQPIYICDVR